MGNTSYNNGHYDDILIDDYNHTHYFYNDHHENIDFNNNNNDAINLNYVQDDNNNNTNTISSYQPIHRHSKVTKSKSESESISIKNNKNYDLNFSNTWSPESTTSKGRNFAEMNVVLRYMYKFYDSYKEINPATLTGAIDVVVVRQEDGSYRSSPFHVRFGKLGVFKSNQKVVDIEINGKQVDGLHMQLGEAGEAYFVEPIEEDEIAQDDEIVSKDDTTIKSLDINNRQALINDKNKTQSIPIISKGQYTDTSSIETINKTIKPKNNDTIDITSSTSLPIIVSSCQDDLIDSSNNELISHRDPTYAVEFGSFVVSDCRDIINMRSVDDKSNSSSPGSYNSGVVDVNKTVDVTTNYYSDGDLTPELTSPIGSRPSTPKSDTEVEKIASDEIKINNEKWDWQWGQFPARTTTNQIATSEIAVNTIRKLSISNSLPIDSIAEQIKPQEPQLQQQKQQQQPISPIKPKSPGKTDEEKKGRFTGMISSLIGGKKTNDDVGGIYLDDTDKLDPELSALYKYQKNYYKPINSLNQVQDEDQESGKGVSLPQSPVPTQKENSLIGDVQISLCGGLNNAQQPDNYDELFQQNLVTFDKFIEDMATITTNPKLVIKVNNRYLNWQAAAPIILSTIVFQKPLTVDQINQLADTHMPKAKQQSQQQSQPAQQSSRWSNWFGKSTSTSTATTTTTPTTTVTATSISPSSTPIQIKTAKSDSVDSDTASIRTLTTGNLSASSSTTTLDAISATNTITANNNSSKSATTENVNKKQSKTEQYRKTTRLSSEFIEKLNLRPGSNSIRYSVTTAFQGTAKIDSFIYLWNYDDNVIVSDIDGTITRSDVLGHVFTMFGKDWTQQGIADCFSAIERNSYKFMYLSARAIGQSQITRNLLRNVNQDGLTLPEGPLFVTPTSLFTAFQKEVIEKKPQEFKISCLEDIKSLFPKGRNAFYAGFGNRVNDFIAYETVGISPSRIFIINPRGELKHGASETFQSSYSKMCDFVDHIFPPVKPSQINAEFSTFNYWKEPLPEIALEDFDEPVSLSNNDLKDSANLSSNEDNNSKNSKKSSKRSVKSPAVTVPTPKATSSLTTTTTTGPSKASSSTSININNPKSNDKNNNNMLTSNQKNNSNSSIDIDSLSKSL